MYSLLKNFGLKLFDAVRCNLMELTTKSVYVPLRVCGIVIHMCWCICLCMSKFLLAKQCFMKHLRQYIWQGSVFPCISLCSFVHLHQ